MNTTAWAWTRGGAAKLERPRISCTVNPAPMTSAIAKAALRKKACSGSAGPRDERATVVMWNGPPDVVATVPRPPSPWASHRR